MRGEIADHGRHQRVRHGHRQGRHPLRDALRSAGVARRLLPGSGPRRARGEPPHACCCSSARIAAAEFLHGRSLSDAPTTWRRCSAVLPGRDDPPATLASLRESLPGVAASKMRVLLTMLKEQRIVTERRGAGFKRRDPLSAERVAALVRAYEVRAESDRAKLDAMAISRVRRRCAGGSRSSNRSAERGVGAVRPLRQLHRDGGACGWRGRHRQGAARPACGAGDAPSVAEQQPGAAGGPLRLRVRHAAVNQALRQLARDGGACGWRGRLKRHTTERCRWPRARRSHRRSTTRTPGAPDAEVNGFW